MKRRSSSYDLASTQSASACGETVQGSSSPVVGSSVSPPVGVVVPPELGSTPLEPVAGAVEEEASVSAAPPLPQPRIKIRNAGAIRRTGGTLPQPRRATPHDITR